MTNNGGTLLCGLVEHLHLQIAYRSKDFDTVALTVPDLSRPGLQLVGHVEHFEPLRLQVIGNAESSYLRGLSREERLTAYGRIFAFKFPAMLIARGLPVDDECLEIAKKYDVSVLRSPEPTGVVINSVIDYLQIALAPTITRHGVLMEVYGEGLLLIGESGIGKSEAAVELLKRGHRLIADDAVDIRKMSDNILVGTAPELIRNYVELRGIGIINVAKLFGMGAVRAENNIDLVVNVVPWNTQEVYDRLGLEDQYMEILGVKIPMNTIPITPGRNLAVILEVAAMNNRQRKLGYNPALEFTQQIDRHFEETVGKP